MYPIAHIFGQEIPSYTVMVVLGFLAGFAVAWSRRARYGLMSNELIGIYALGGAGAFLGGKTFYIVQGFPGFLEQHALTGLSFATYVTDAGFVFYGGLIGALVCMALAAKAFRMDMWLVIDCVLPSLPLGQAFGRVGCLLVGCCYGMPSQIGFYIDPIVQGPPHDVRLFPIQLVESACCVGIFFLLLHLSRATGKPNGFLLGTYLLTYGIARFIIEFFRYDSIRGFIGPLSVSQWFSLGAIALGIVFLLHKKKTPADDQTGAKLSSQESLLKY